MQSKILQETDDYTESYGIYAISALSQSIFLAYFYSPQRRIDTVQLYINVFYHTPKVYPLPQL